MAKAKKDYYRTSLRLPTARQQELAIMRGRLGITTDSAVMNEALVFRARFAAHSAVDLELGAWLLKQIDALNQDSSSDTRQVVVEVPAQGDKPATVHRLVIPRFTKP